MGFVNALTEWRAQRWLVTFGNRLGTDGLLVAAAVPGLAAALDQHAAAVRDIVAQAGRTDATLTERVLLAGYARSLLDRFDVSVRQVRRHADGPVDAGGLAGVAPARRLRAEPLALGPVGHRSHRGTVGTGALTASGGARLIPA